MLCFSLIFCGFKWENHFHLVRDGLLQKLVALPREMEYGKRKEIQQTMVIGATIDELFPQEIRLSLAVMRMGMELKSSKTELGNRNWGMSGNNVALIITKCGAD